MTRLTENSQGGDLASASLTAEGLSEVDTTARLDAAAAPVFVGWMLWNIVRHQHISRGTTWWPGRDAIFEDLPPDQQTAWSRAAADLQQRAKSFGRLI
jgi:hypothetical protein